VLRINQRSASLQVELPAVPWATDDLTVPCILLGLPDVTVRHISRDGPTGKRSSLVRTGVAYGKKPVAASDDSTGTPCDLDTIYGSGNEVGNAADVMFFRSHNSLPRYGP